MTHSPLARRSAPPAALLLATLLLVSGCSGSSEDGDSAGSSAATEDKVALADTSGGGESATRTAVEVRTASVISTGVVSLRTKDVDDAVFEVERLVDEYDGTVADSETRSDREGQARTARLVLRIPSADFDAAMGDLAGLASWSESSRTSEDVSTQVIDNAVRIRAQRASLARVEALLTRAESIRDVMAIEAQLTRRQADLDSLAGQQAWLADQTSLATIKVHLERSSGEDPADDEDGFLSGLAAGWDGLTGAGVVAATVAGAVLPFAVVGLLLGVPLWRLARWVRGRRVTPGTTGRTASAE